MSHSDQVGGEDAAEGARRAHLPRWRRALAGHGGTALLAMAWVAAIAVMMEIKRFG